MEWIVKIEAEKDQRIRVTFNPVMELIHFFAEKRINNKWHIFSQDTHGIEITLEQLQKKMGDVVTQMRTRLKEYNNVAEGFSVIKEIAFLEDQED